MILKNNREPWKWWWKWWWIWRIWCTCSAKSLHQHQHQQRQQQQQQHHHHHHFPVPPLGCRIFPFFVSRFPARSRLCDAAFLHMCSHTFPARCGPKHPKLPISTPHSCSSSALTAFSARTPQTMPLTSTKLPFCTQTNFHTSQLSHTHTLYYNKRVLRKPTSTPTNSYANSLSTKLRFTFLHQTTRYTNDLFILRTFLPHDSQMAGRSSVTLPVSADQVPGHLDLPSRSWTETGFRGSGDGGWRGNGQCSSRVLKGGMSPSELVCCAGSGMIRLAANGTCAARVRSADQRAIEAWTAAARSVCGTTARLLFTQINCSTQLFHKHTQTTFCTNIFFQTNFKQINFCTNEFSRKPIFKQTTSYANHPLHQPTLHNPCFRSAPVAIRQAKCRNMSNFQFGGARRKFARTRTHHTMEQLEAHRYE